MFWVSALVVMRFALKGAAIVARSPPFMTARRRRRVAHGRAAVSSSSAPPAVLPARPRRQILDRRVPPYRLRTEPHEVVEHRIELHPNRQSEDFRDIGGQRVAVGPEHRRRELGFDFVHVREERLFHRAPQLRDRRPGYIGQNQRPVHDAIDVLPTNRRRHRRRRKCPHLWIDRSEHRVMIHDDLIGSQRDQSRAAHSAMRHMHRHVGRMRADGVAICSDASTSPPGACTIKSIGVCRSVKRTARIISSEPLMSMYRITGIPRKAIDTCRWINVITRAPLRLDAAATDARAPIRTCAGASTGCSMIKMQNSHSKSPNDIAASNHAIQCHTRPPAVLIGTGEPNGSRWAPTSFALFCRLYCIEAIVLTLNVQFR
jgi:hypothetical protein